MVDIRAGCAVRRGSAPVQSPIASLLAGRHHVVLLTSSMYTIRPCWQPGGDHRRVELRGRSGQAVLVRVQLEADFAGCPAFGAAVAVGGVAQAYWVRSVASAAGTSGKGRVRANRRAKKRSAISSRWSSSAGAGQRPGQCGTFGSPPPGRRSVRRRPRPSPTPVRRASPRPPPMLRRLISRTPPAARHRRPQVEQGLVGVEHHCGQRGPPPPAAHRRSTASTGSGGGRRGRRRRPAQLVDPDQGDAGDDQQRRRASCIDGGQLAQEQPGEQHREQHLGQPDERRQLRARVCGPRRSRPRRRSRRRPPTGR